MPQTGGKKRGKKKGSKGAVKTGKSMHPKPMAVSLHPNNMIPKVKHSKQLGGRLSPGQIKDLYGKHVVMPKVYSLPAQGGGAFPVAAIGTAAYELARHYKPAGRIQKAIEPSRKKIEGFRPLGIPLGKVATGIVDGFAKLGLGQTGGRRYPVIKT